MTKQSDNQKKCEELKDFIRSNNIEGSFRIKVGICNDYKKATEAFIKTMDNYHIKSLYCWVAYQNLLEFKNIVLYGKNYYEKK